MNLIKVRNGKQIMNSSLYGQVSDLIRIENALDSEDNQKTQSELIELIQTKVDSVVYFAQSQEDLLEAFDKRIKELQEAKKIVSSRNERFEKYIISCLDLLQTQSLKGTLSTISLRKPSQIVEIYDEGLLSPELFRTKSIIEVDKETIKEKIKNGQEIQGAKLIEGKRTVSFKIGVKK